MESLSLSSLTITPQYEFTEDERKSFLRKHADEAYSEGVPLSELPMIKLIPGEIRENIFAYLLGDEQVRVDITTSRGTTFRLREGTPTLFRGPLKKLLEVGDDDIRNEVTRFLHKCVTYFNENGDTLERLPQILGKDVALIHRLEIRLNFKTKCKHRGFWPDFLVALQALPNLEYLRLYSTSEQFKSAYNEQESGDPDGTITKHQQEVRALRLLGSFAVLRHSNLDIMVQPARSQPHFRDHQGRFVHEYELFKYDEERPIKFNQGDQIINTTASRRVKWTEGCLMNPTSLWITLQPGQSKKDLKSSETTDVDDKHFRSVDARAYQTNDLLQTRGLSWKPYDALVEQSRRKKLDADTRVAQAPFNNRSRGNARRNNTTRGRGSTRRADNAESANNTTQGQNINPRGGNVNSRRGGNNRGRGQDLGFEGTDGQGQRRAYSANAFGNQRRA